MPVGTNRRGLNDDFCPFGFSIVGAMWLGRLAQPSSRKRQIDRIDVGHVAIPGRGLGTAAAAAPCEARKPPSNSQASPNQTASAITHRS